VTVTPTASPDAFAALRIGEFRALTALALTVMVAVQAQAVAIGWALYQITRDPLVLGLVGLAEALPFIGLALFGGYLADHRDKRTLMRIALALMVVASLLLIGVMHPEVRARMGHLSWLALVYAALMLMGLARGLFAPSATALRAFVVPRALYPNGAAWSSTAMQTGMVLGPLLGGLGYAVFGLQATLLGCTALLLLAMGLTGCLTPRPPLSRRTHGQTVIQNIAEGLAFVRRTPVILYSLALDLLVVLFGGVIAILPMFAEEILRIGPEELGVLRAAPAVGAILTILICTRFTPTVHAWRNLLLACAGFGAATLAFAVSSHFWLSVAALFATGAFDSVSVVIRQTLLQIYTPDALRGRVQAVNSVFISTSNEIGAFESGLAAKLLGAVPSVVFGGAMTLGITGFIGRRTRSLLALRVQPDA
jgi:MFS family permease